MKTVRITSDFTGYPAGKRRDFRTGEEAEVSNEFSELIIAKGLAKEVSGSTTAKASDAEAKDADK